MASFSYPGTIDANTPAVASEVQTNFDSLLAWVLANLVQADGSVAMTGPLVLAPGAPASPSHAVNKEYVDGITPVGVIQAYAGTLLPSKWLWCNGDTYTTSSKPALSAALGIAYNQPGTPPGSFSVPDLSMRIPAGRDYDGADAAFALGFKNAATQRNTELVEHVHSVPIHGHASSASTNFETQDHVHGLGSAGGTMSNAAPHTHNFGDGSQIWYSPGSGQGFSPVSGAGVFHAALATFAGSGAAAGVHTHTLTGQTDARSAAHNHSVSISVNDKPAFDTVKAGTATVGTDKNLPPYLVVNYIIYAGA